MKGIRARLEDSLPKMRRHDGRGEHRHDPHRSVEPRGKRILVRCKSGCGGRFRWLNVERVPDTT